jgi:alginate O-acetyltransferase complex protein AlgI
MLFNSLLFIGFFIIAFIVFWLLKNNLKQQNGFLLIASAVFYGWWDWRFLVLLFVAAYIDFYFGQTIYNSTSEKKRKVFIWLSAGLNIGLLGYFKYFNFFIDSFISSMNLLGVHTSVHTLSIILPVGISYYTFQSMSYSLDIYRNKLKPTDSLIDYMAFICFFPQLVAGPVERATFLLPQFSKMKIFNYEEASDGLRLILYGFFKKIVIADNIAVRVDPIFNNPDNYTGLEIFLGATFFIMQLYGDLSGYTDIARGTAKLLDFKLSKNFETPFFSSSVPEEWRRWHMTITNWFRDYFFLPLVKLKIEYLWWKIFSTILLFVVIGFWHGANYTFLIFGFINGLYFIPTLLSKDRKWLKNSIKFLNTNVYVKPFAILGTYILFSITTVLFRAKDVSSALAYYKGMLKPDFWGVSYFMSDMLIGIILFQTFEWFMQHREHQFEITHWPPYLRRFSYAVLVVIILLLGNFGEAPFYYFQF